MSKRGENIYHRKDGRWEGRYIKGRKQDGTPKFGSVYGKQYGEVKKKLLIAKAQFSQVSADMPITHKGGKLREWSDYWIEIIIRPHVRLETYAGYRRNLDNHICRYLGDMDIEAITPQHVQNLIDRLQDELAATTLHGIYRLLKSMFAAAYEKGLITHIPCQRIKLPKVKRRPPRVLTQAEQKKLEKEIFSSDETEYLLCLYMGLRVGEVCALRWEDVDFENNILHIRYSVHRTIREAGKGCTKLVLGDPKSESSVRDIPLPQFLTEILLKKKESAQGDVGEFLYQGTKTSCRDPRTMQQRIGIICKKLDIKGVHMHTLRHTFATRCLEKGVQYEVLSELLGHSSPQITLRHYAHCTPETKRLSIERIAPYPNP